MDSLRLIRQKRSKSTETSSTDSLLNLSQTSIRAESKQVSDQKPTMFVLRGIDPHQIRETYLQGRYRRLVVPRSPIRNLQSPEIIQGRLKIPREANCYDESYRVNSNGVVSSYVTLGQEDFAAAQTKIQTGQDLTTITLLRKGNCHRCGADFARVLGPDEYPVGAPIKLVKKGDYYIFTFSLETRFCGFGCKSAYLKRRAENRYDGHRYVRMIQIDRLLFKLIYPDEDLSSLPDLSLHQDRQGPLTDQEYCNRRFSYKITPNIITLPAKCQVMVQQLGA